MKLERKIAIILAIIIFPILLIYWIGSLISFTTYKINWVWKEIEKQNKKEL